jgi:acyl dehydratase
MRVFSNVAEFAAAAGQLLGTSDWHTVTQDQVNLFADATGDHQWIHVDPDRAVTGPFQTPIAHGYLTLSLLPTLTRQIYRIDSLAMGINYGSDRVRFPQPVPVGSRLRARVTLRSVQETSAGLQARLSSVVEIENARKPACVAELIQVLVASAGDPVGAPLDDHT